MEELCLNRPTVWHASFARCLMWDDNEPRPSTTAGTVNKNLWKFLHDFTNRHWHFLLVFRHVVFTYLLSVYKLRQFETANRAETKQLQGITKKILRSILFLYNEESLVTSNLRSNLRFHCANSTLPTFSMSAAFKDDLIRLS